MGRSHQSHATANSINWLGLSYNNSRTFPCLLLGARALFLCIGVDATVIRPKVTELVMEWNASNDHHQQSGALLIAGNFLSAYCCYHHKLFSYQLASYWPHIAAGLLWPIAFCLLPFAYCPYYVDILPIAYC